MLEKVISKLPALIIGSIVVFTPLFFLRIFQNSFDFSKNLLFHTLVLLALFALGVKIFKEKQLAIFPKRFTSPFALFIYGFFLIFFTATIFSDIPLISFYGNYERGQGLLQWLFYLAFFCGMIFLFTKETFEKTGGWIIGAATLISFYAMSQFLGFDFLFEGYHRLFFVGRAFSTLGNPDFLGQYIGPLLPLALALFLHTKKTSIRALLIMSIAYLFFALFASGSRAPILGLIFASIFFFITVVRKYAKFKKITFAMIISLFIFSSAVIFTPLKNAPLINRFSISEDNIRSLKIRLILWESAARLIQENPFFGHGLESFRLYFPHVVKGGEFFGLEQDFNIFPDRVHNELLEFGIAGGIPAMALYLFFIMFLLWHYFSRDPRESIRENIILHSFYAGIFVILFQNLVTFSELSHWLLFFFFLAGIIILETSGEPSKILFKRHSPLFIVSSFVVLALIILGWNHMVLQPARAEYHYTNSFFEQDFATSVEELKKATRLNPTAAFYWYELLMRDSSSMPRAVAALEKLEGQTINIQTWKAILLSKEYPQEAYELFDHLVAVNPNYPHLRLAYADSLFRNGERTARARRPNEGAPKLGATKARDELYNQEFEKAIPQYEAFLEASPPFWKWKYELSAKTEYQQKQFRIFFSGGDEFWEAIGRLADSYEQIENFEKADFYWPYSYPPEDMQYAYWLR